MTTAARRPDPEKLKDVARHVFGMLGGAMVSGMIFLGDRLGLYRELRGAGPVTSDELARKTGLDERWIREWLRGQAAARILDYLGDERFELSPEAAVILADESHPACGAGFFSQLPKNMAVLEKIPEAFRTGVGLPYDAFGPEGAVGIERGFAPWYRTLLVRTLRKLDGVVAKVEAGGRAADVGCGSGVALIEMAKAFPKSEFHGYDISRHALSRAEVNRTEAGLTNVTFHEAQKEPLPTDASFDLVCTFDCVHDMVDPPGVIRAIRAALKPDGTWFLVDIKAKPTFEENMRDNPVCAMMYGFSIIACMSSALSEPGGAGLGTLGFPETLAREMSEKAGFTRFRRLEVEHPMNAFYEIRP